MNFLAHTFLSCQEDELLLGNFMADFIKNRNISEYPESIRRGIFLHRTIDSFTDNHTQVRKGSHRLRKIHRKYAPVVIDVLYDYVLANNWEKYSNQTLKKFTEKVYKVLKENLELFPERLQKIVPIMVSDDFLYKYKSKIGLKKALERMDRRTKFPSNFTLAISQLEEEWELFNEEFNAFFPEVIKVSQSFCNC